MIPPKFSELGLITRGDWRSWAVLSPCEKYRYVLGRSWGVDEQDSGTIFSIVMMNPSTADHTVDDPTIRRCIHFAKQEGCSSLIVRNLFAYRATDPRELTKVQDPVGPSNESILQLDITFGVRVAAWGTFKSKRHRSLALRSMSQARMQTNFVLGLTSGDRTKDLFVRPGREPRHPLYLSNTTRAVLWRDALKVD